MNMQEMMRQAQKMQKKMAAVQEEAAGKIVEGDAGGGMVTVSANGRSEIISVKIEKEVVDPEEIEMLQDLVVAAANQALSKAGEMMQAEVSKITGGMNMPGLF